MTEQLLVFDKPQNMFGRSSDFKSVDGRCDVEDAPSHHQVGNGNCLQRLGSHLIQRKNAEVPLALPEYRDHFGMEGNSWQHETSHKRHCLG